MNKEEGTFPFEIHANYAPGQLSFPRFKLPNLERAEREEAAARLLHFSQQMNSWVGVSWNRLVAMMKEEHSSKDHPMFSLVSLGGPRPIQIGLSELIDAELVRHEKTGGEDIFFPTAKLISLAEKFATAN